MATKTITITKDAYERLKPRKRDGERFTETIIRTTEGEREVMDGFGAMCDVEGTRAELDSDLHGRSGR